MNVAGPAHIAPRRSLADQSEPEAGGPRPRQLSSAGLGRQRPRSRRSRLPVSAGAGRQHARDLAEAWRVAATLVARPALADQLALLLEALPRIAGADTATLYLRDESSGALRVVAHYGYTAERIAGPRSSGLTEHVLATGQPLIVDDVLADPRVNPSVVQAGLRSFVALPLIARRPSLDTLMGAPPPAPLRPGGEPPPAAAGLPLEHSDQPGLPDRPPATPETGAAPAGTLRSIGVLYVNARRPHAFDASTVETVKGLAALASVAIENGYLLEQQRATAQQLREALALREQFASAASHELKTPLTPLKGYAEAIRSRFEQAAAGGPAVDPSWLHRALGIMLDQIDRLDQLVTDLLDVSRLRTGRFTISPEPLDLAEEAQAIFTRFRDTVPAQLELLAPGASARPVLELRLGAPSLRGEWDRTRIDQLITNLLSNAVKYSPRGGTITLTVEPASLDNAAWRTKAPELGPGWVHLAVSDQGIGLPPDEESRAALFEPFSRGSNVPSERFSGFGLGLYICAEIVRRHGGVIWAESVGADQGSTFHVLLPPGPPPPDASLPGVASSGL